MSDTVIKVENLSKLYRLGEISTGTLRSDFQRWWAQVRGKEDPLTKVGHENDRSTKAEKGETVWALKDIHFEVKQGEVLGIIGKNGAGKSTLLKILSQVTTPTTGHVKVKGRIASLLEVGTGFHPELTGRENIFLNGAILGMTKNEIRSKFDEIVDFAGVAKYIDTPVKRYSSGMYVRLAFAVAAHLEPEILIVDEVLAVGDSEFQSKALGKMKDVSEKEGRTVLFVSHNMPAIQKLCSQGLILQNGLFYATGLPDAMVGLYLKNSTSAKTMFGNNQECYIEKCTIENSLSESNPVIKSGEKVELALQISSKYDLELNIGIAIYDENSFLVLASNSIDNNEKPLKIYPGKNTVNIEFKLPVKAGNYNFEFSLNSLETKQYDRFYWESSLIIISERITKLSANWQGMLEEAITYKSIYHD